MSWAGRLRRAWKSRAQVEAEVDEELADHLARTESALRGAGRSPEEARSGAEARFGDVAGVRRACVRIQTGERIMLQRINLVLIIVLGLTLGWGTFATHTAQKRQAEVLARIAEKLEAVPARASEAAVVPITRRNGTVYLSGQVARPGAFHCPDGFTVRRLMAAAGEPQPGATKVSVRTEDGSFRGGLTVQELADAKGADLDVRPGDLVVVD